MQWESKFVFYLSYQFNAMASQLQEVDAARNYLDLFICLVVVYTREMFVCNLYPELLSMHNG